MIFNVRFGFCKHYILPTSQATFGTLCFPVYYTNAVMSLFEE